MRKILISAIYFLSISAFAQSKEQIKTWDLLLNNKRTEARNFYDKNLKENKTKDFENLFLDALIEEEMGELVFDDLFVKNFIDMKIENNYLYPILHQKFLFGELEASLDDYSYSKVDLLAQAAVYGEESTMLEYKSTLDRRRNDYKGADDRIAKIKRIDKWQFAGVFENLNGSGLYNEYEPETYANNDKLFNANSFGNVGWYNRKFLSNDGFEFFVNEMEYGRGITYAQSYIENPVERKILLEVDTNTEFRLFLNDSEILSSTHEGYTNLGSHLVEVIMPKGVNRLLLKFDVKNSDNCFMVVPFDANYQRISDMKYFDTYQNYQNTSLAQLQPKELPLRFETFLKEKISQNPDSFFYKYLLVSGYLNNSQNEQAKELLDGFLKLYPKSSLVQSLLTKYYSNIEDTEKVVEIFRNIEMADSEYFVVPIMKMMDGDKLKDLPIKELEKYRDILNKTKAKPMGEFFDVIIALRNKDMENVQKHVANLKKNFANNEKFFVIFTTLEDLEKKDQSGSIKKLEEVFEKKNSSDIMDALYTYYQNSNRIEDQKKLLKRYIELFPQVNSFRSKYINLIDEDVQNPEVLKEIENALGNFPYSYTMLGTKAEILAKQNKKNEAVKFAKLSLSHNTENEEMHKLVRDLDQTEDEISLTSIKDIYKLIGERRNKGVKGKKGVTTLLDEYIVNVYPEGGLKKKSTYVYEITSEKGIDEMKEYYLNYYDKVIKSEIVKSNGNIIPGEKSEDQIVFTNLAIGDVVFIQKESLERNSGRFYKDFNLSSYFNSEYPVVESIFTVITPENMNYQVKSNNKDVSSSKKKIGDKLFQTWKLNDLPEVDLDEYYSPSFYDATISVTANSIKTWQEISNWYADLTKKSLVSDKVVERALKEIFPNGFSTMNETEKAEKIYNYIEKNVSYSSVDFRQSGYIPQKPSKTLITKLGDCKDLSTLFVILGNQAGLKSNLVLVQTNNNSVQRLLLPNLSFNHCIVRVSLDGKETYLEMTDKYLPFNSVVKSNYKAKGLVIYTDKVSNGFTDLIDISIDNNKKNSFKTVSEVTISGESQNFLTKQYVMGETKSHYNDFFQDEQTDDYRKKNIEEEYGSVLDKVINVKSVKLLEGKDLTSKPLAYEVQFNINDKPQSVGSLKIMKIPFVTKPFTKEVVATENRNMDIQYTKYERENTYFEEVHLSIPESMKFIEIPENKSLAYNNFNYSINYELEKNNKLKITRIANTPWDNIKKEQYPEFKKFVEEAINSENQILGYK
jgi:lipopolysaccharide biosynthesis regulator YciM